MADKIMRETEENSDGSGNMESLTAIRVRNEYRKMAADWPILDDPSPSKCAIFGRKARLGVGMAKFRKIPSRPVDDLNGAECTTSLAASRIRYGYRLMAADCPRSARNFRGPWKAHWRPNGPLYGL